MSALIRTAALRNYIELAAELGGDPNVLLRKARISPETVRGRDTFITFRSMLRLLELTANALECTDFGIRMAIRQNLEIFGPLALAAQSCETVGATVECFSKYFHTHNPSVQITTSQKVLWRTTQISFHMLLSKPPPHPQFNERCVALTHTCLKLIAAGYVRPLRVLLPHGRLSTAKAYRDYFDCEVRFDQPVTAIEVAASDMRRSLPAHNPELHLIATDFLEKFGAKPNALLGLRVREAIKPLLSTGECSHTQIAEILHLHSRTLQRRLAEEGTSFEIIKDEVRREMAQHYLTTTPIPLTQIAALLGYSEQSALARSCQRWFNCTPVTLRQGLARPKRRAKR